MAWFEILIFQPLPLTTLSWLPNVTVMVLIILYTLHCGWKFMYLKLAKGGRKQHSQGRLEEMMSIAIDGRQSAITILLFKATCHCFTKFTVWSSWGLLLTDNLMWIGNSVNLVNMGQQGLLLEIQV